MIQITRAIYGTGTQIADVTAKLREWVADGMVSVDVSGRSFEVLPWALGGDPAPGLSKTLEVDFIDSAGTVAHRSFNDFERPVMDLRGLFPATAPAAGHSGNLVPWLIGLGLLWALMK